MPDLARARTDIMIVISDLGSGGAQRVACALAGYWSRAGRKVAVVTLSDPGSDFFKLPQGVERASIGLNEPSRSTGGGLLNNIRRIWRLRLLLRRMRPAVAVGFVGPTAALVVAAAIGTGVRTVAAERNDPARQSFGSIWDRIRMLAYRWADRVTVNSRGAVESLSGFVASDRLMLTPNPVPDASDGPAAALGEPTVLAVGRLHRQKAHDVLLDAFARAALPGWQLVVLGEGGERAALNRQAGALGIAGCVRFEGQVADPAQYYRAAQIFVLASRHEGTPNALMEAMAYGLPCIVSDAAGGSLELISDGGTGIVVPVDDAAALAAALQRLAADAALRERLGTAAKAAITARRERDDALVRWDAAIEFAGKRGA